MQINPVARIRLFAVLSLVFLLAGCGSPTLIVLEDPLTILEDRTFAAAQEDSRIRLDIRSLFIDYELGRLKNVTVDVYEGAVMLTGTVVIATDKNQAGTLATSVAGANPVYNEIQVTESASLEDAAADLSLEKKIKSELRDAKGVHSVNMRWRSVNRIAYLFGRALSEAERDKAVATVSGVPGVREVVDRLKIVPLED